MRATLIYDDSRDVCKVLPVHQLPTPHAGYVLHRVGHRPVKISLMSVLMLVNLRLLCSLVKLVRIKPHSATTGAETIILSISSLSFKGNPASGAKRNKFFFKNVVNFPSAERTYFHVYIDIFAAVLALSRLIHVLFHYTLLIDDWNGIWKMTPDRTYVNSSHLSIKKIGKQRHLLSIANCNRAYSANLAPPWITGNNQSDLAIARKLEPFGLQFIL